ncbi:MAG TPA: hypothetical protein VN782_04495 [Usitatibacter sp.]|nr:hypothetical protein [Usitatibacter sp.]
MKTLWIAGAACVVQLATVPAHAKALCDIHRLGYTQAQCDECANMTWSVSRVFPRGTCVSTAAPQPVTIGKPVPAPAKKSCDMHHLGYTQAQCDQCSNMRWSVSKVFPRGECVGTAQPQPIATGGKAGSPAGASCTLTSWGGATIPLSAPNFSGTGVRVGACSKGYDLAKSQLHCSTGIPAQAFNYPTTNVTCNKTTGAPVFNPQVTINGRPCCLD